MDFIIDPKLLRKKEEESVFTKQYEYPTGAKLFVSGAKAQRFIPILAHMEFRVTMASTKTDQESVHVWFKPDEYSAYMSEQQKNADAKSIREYKNAMKTLIPLSIISSIVVGALASLGIWVIATIFSLNTTSLWWVFSAFGGFVFIIWVLSFIQNWLSRGRLS